MHIVITGANRGIGLALTKNYLAQGHEVTAICRHASPELKNTSAAIIENIDVAQSDAAEKVAAALDSKAIDILINNAGVLRSETLEDFSVETIQEQLTINSIAPIAITQALQFNFKAGGKVALITSRMGSVTDNGSGSYYGYRMSKAALNAAGKSLAIDLKPRDISVAILHPGFVQTEMVGGAGDITAETAAERLISRITELNIKTSGTFWHSNGEVLPW